jgi:hypothetical protein
MNAFCEIDRENPCARLYGPEVTPLLTGWELVVEDGVVEHQPLLLDVIRIDRGVSHPSLKRHGQHPAEQNQQSKIQGAVANAVPDITHGADSQICPFFLRSAPSKP